MQIKESKKWPYESCGKIGGTATRLKKSYSCRKRRRARLGNLNSKTVNQKKKRSSISPLQDEMGSWNRGNTKEKGSV